jgi:hypothetical protein
MEAAITVCGTIENPQRSKDSEAPIVAAALSFETGATVHI